MQVRRRLSWSKRKLRNEDRRVDPGSPGWGREKDGEVPHERCCCFRLVFIWGLDLWVISTETSEKDTFFFSYLASMEQMVTCPNLQPLIQAKHNTIFQTDSQSFSASQVATSLKTTKSPSIPIYPVCKIPSLVGSPGKRFLRALRCSVLFQCAS